MNFHFLLTDDGNDGHRNVLVFKDNIINMKLLFLCITFIKKDKPKALYYFIVCLVVEIRVFSIARTRLHSYQGRQNFQIFILYQHGHFFFSLKKKKI